MISDFSGELEDGFIHGGKEYREVSPFGKEMLSFARIGFKMSVKIQGGRA